MLRWLDRGRARKGPERNMKRSQEDRFVNERPSPMVSLLLLHHPRRSRLILSRRSCLSSSSNNSLLKR